MNLRCLDPWGRESKIFGGRKVEGLGPQIAGWGIYETSQHQIHDKIR